MYDQGGYRGYRGLSPEVWKKGLAGLVQFPVPLFHGTLQCQPSLSTHRDLGILPPLPVLRLVMPVPAS